MDFDLNDAMLGLLGGLMIGAASAIFLLGLGRIAGISGILGAALSGAGTRVRARAENIAFLAGLIAAPALMVAVSGPLDITGVAGPAGLVVAGLLVGIGTRMGNGCTSGHGVCGMSRFSTRSFAAVGVFMVVAAIVASLISPIFGA